MHSPTAVTCGQSTNNPRRGRVGLSSHPKLLSEADGLCKSILSLLTPEHDGTWWWEQYGGCVPELKAVACLVLSQPASASIVERINSEFAFVKDRRRNRLDHIRADKLVALFHNLRLICRMKNPAYTEPAVSWTDDVEKSGITRYGVAHYE